MMKYKIKQGGQFMKKCFMNKIMNAAVLICSVIVALSALSAFSVCYAIEDKIDASKLKGYYIELYETETNNRFKNGYGIIQDRLEYSQSTKHGLIDENYNVVLEPDTYFQIVFDEMNQNIIYGFTDPQFHFGDAYKITNTGLVKINKEMYYFTPFLFSDMTAVKNKNSEYGVIDRDGNIIIDFTKDCYYSVYGPLIIRYDILNADPFSHLTLGNAEILDKKGNVLTHSKYDLIYVFLDYPSSKPDVTAIEVVKGEKLNLLNLNDYTEGLDWSYKAFQDYKGYIFAENSAGKWGMLNKNLQVVINFDYDNADFITKTPYWYRNGIKEFIILPEDKPKVPTNLTAKLPTFDITLNGVKIQNDTRLYPFIVYNDITYFPMTYYDSRFLNLKTEWNTTTGLKVSKANESSGYITDTTKIKHPTTIKPTIAGFDIYINNQKIDNENEPYPLLIYKDVTYFPMTWRFGVDEFGWDYRYTNEKGLQIISQY